MNKDDWGETPNPNPDLDYSANETYDGPDTLGDIERALSNDAQRKQQRKRKRDHLKPVPTPGGATLDDESRAYCISILNDEVDKVSNSLEGQRNSDLNWACYRIGKFLHHGAFTQDDVETRMLAACQLNGYLDDADHGGDTGVRRAISRGLRDGMRDPQPIPDAEHIGRVTYVDDDDGVTPALNHVAALFNPMPYEDDFWDSRESLSNIYDASLSRMCSPWSVFAFVAARVLASVGPRNVLPPIIGGRGSLNWFACIVAPSGSGKGGAAAVAERIVLHDVYERNVGSGEGMIAAFHKRGDAKTGEPDEFHESIMFTAHEIDVISAMNQRSGSTTMAVLRSAFSGETLGNSYVTKGRDIHVDAHTYRMTFVVAVQPSRAGTLLDDHGGGTPQRFMWFPAVDPRISEEHVRLDDWLPAIDIPRFKYDTEIRIPELARKDIVAARVAAMRGTGADGLGHTMFSREKLAVALAMMDGRTHVNDEDWRLSGIAANVSGACLKWVTGQLKSEREQEARERGELQGITSHASDVTKQHETARANSRMFTWIMKRVAEQSVTRVVLRKQAASRDRTTFDGVVSQMISDGVLEVGNDDTLRKAK